MDGKLMLDSARVPPPTTHTRRSNGTHAAKCLHRTLARAYDFVVSRESVQGREVGQKVDNAVLDRIGIVHKVLVPDAEHARMAFQP